MGHQFFTAHATGLVRRPAKRTGLTPSGYQKTGDIGLVVSSYYTYLLAILEQTAFAHAPGKTARMMAWTAIYFVACEAGAASPTSPIKTKAAGGHSRCSGQRLPAATSRAHAGRPP